jgi:hypothetical protein
MASAAAETQRSYPVPNLAKLHFDVVGTNATLREVLSKVDDEEVLKERSGDVV